MKEVKLSMVSFIILTVMLALGVAAFILIIVHMSTYHHHTTPSRIHYQSLY